MTEPGPVSASPRPRLSIWRVLGSLLSLGLLVFLVWRQGWDEFLEALHMLPWTYVLAAFGLMLVSRLAVTLRWYVLLRSAGLKISFGQALRLVFMGLFSSNFLPSTVGGDLVRLAGAMYLRLDAGIVAASLVVDRLVGMAGMAAFLPFGLAASFQSGGLPGADPSAAVAPLPLMRKLWQRGLRFARSLAASAMFWIQHPASLGRAFLFTLLHMLMTFLAVRILLDGMGESLSFWWIGGLWSFSYFISLAPVSINGLGLQEVSITYLYSHFGGVSMNAGLVLALFMRMLPMLASLPGVLFLPDILRPIPRSLPPVSGGDGS